MRDDIAARPIAWAALAIAATVAAAIAAVFLLLRSWDTPAGASRVSTPAPVPGPALQSAPQLDLAQERAAKQRVLESTGWVDASRGIARIPIADAMALLAASAASAPRAPEPRP